MYTWLNRIYWCVQKMKCNTIKSKGRTTVHSFWSLCIMSLHIHYITAFNQYIYIWTMNHYFTQRTEWLVLLLKIWVFVNSGVWKLGLETSYHDKFFVVFIHSLRQDVNPSPSAPFSCKNSSSFSALSQAPCMHLTSLGMSLNSNIQIIDLLLSAEVGNRNSTVCVCMWINCLCTQLQSCW